MICSSVNRPFFISESPFVASSYRADLKILNFIWSKLPRAGQEDLSSGHRCPVESEERIECSESGDGWRGKLLSSVVNAAPANQIDIEVTARRQMNDGIQGGRKHIDISIGKSNAVEGCTINPEAIVIRLDHYPNILGKVETNPTLDIPTLIQVPAGIPDRLGETAA
jgi:hypothetical protein